MIYHDIEMTLARFKNYEIPIIPEVLTNFIIRYPETYSLFLNRKKHH
ncbi:hypothetical protein [Acholeplasma laidlawii]|nr:hypothetical protein [Acholeplasma laidlawii]